MDILDILNGYIKENKTELELASEFFGLLNRGDSIEKIAVHYKLEPFQIKEILQKNNFLFNPAANVWEKAPANNPVSDSSLSTQEQLSNNTDKEKDSVERKLDYERIINLLNIGTSLGTVSKMYDLSPNVLQNKLIMNNYYYHPFLERWSNMNELELCEYFATKLGNTLSLYDLSKSYFTSNKKRITFVNKVEQLFKEQGFKFNQEDKTWQKRNNENSNSVITPKIEAELEFPQSKKLSSIDILAIANKLNNGATINNLSTQYDITTQKLRTALINDGFHYYFFIKYWTKIGDSNLSEHLVNQLNSGLNMEKLLQRYNIRKSEYTDCLTGLKNFLHSQGYTYSITNNKWVKSISNPDLKLIVDELNKTESLKEVAKKFKMSDIALRNLLKSNAYHYYGLLNVWTNKSDSEILNQIAYELLNEKLTFNDLANQNIDIQRLEQALKKEGCKYKQNTEITLSEDRFVPETKNTINKKIQNPIEETIKDTYSPESSPTLSSEEIYSLKEMINHWNEERREKNSINSKSEKLNIYLSSSLLSALTEKAEQEGLSRSLIIEQALKNYIK